MILGLWQSGDVTFTELVVRVFGEWSGTAIAVAAVPAARAQPATSAEGRS